MPEKILQDCYELSKECIRKCTTPNGLFASGGVKPYDAIWSRDSMISMIGASLIKDKCFKEVFRQSIITLSENQGKSGQIPNCVDKWSDRKGHVDFQTIDSSLWYIIGHYAYKERYKDNSLFEKYSKNIQNALSWLACQDSSERGLLAQLPTSDWQDAFPHRYGYTINTQALYYKVLELTGKAKDARKLKFEANENLTDALWDGQHYYSYRWKNHGKYKEVGEWFDSLGNLLAIIFGLADEEKSNKIIDYIRKNKINVPYPIWAIYPPIKKGSIYWQDYYLDCNAGQPNHYLNGGIWPYIGAFYVLSLIKLKRFKEAEEELKKIAQANVENNFPEWIDPTNRKAHDKDSWQAWNAGAYILAHESFIKKKVLI